MTEKEIIKTLATIVVLEFITLMALAFIEVQQAKIYDHLSQSYETIFERTMQMQEDNKFNN